MAAVRGTTIGANCELATHVCTFTVLAGSALITPLRGATLTLTPNTAVTVAGTLATGIRAEPIQMVTQEQSNQLVQEFDMKLGIRAAVGQEQTGEAQLQTATLLANALVGTLGRDPTLTTLTSPNPTPDDAAVITAPIAPSLSRVVTNEPPPPPEPAPPPIPPEPPPEVPPSRIVLSGISTATTPLLTVADSLVLPAPDRLFEVPLGEDASIAGILLDATNATMVLGANGILIDGLLTSLTTDALFRFEATNATIAGSLVNVGPQGSFTGAGPLAQLSDSRLTTGSGPLILVAAGNSLDISIAAASPLINLQGSLLNSAGPLLDLANSHIALVGPVAGLRQQSLLTNAAGPVLRLAGGSLGADAVISTDGLTNQLVLTGPLMDLSNTTVTLRQVLDRPSQGTDTMIHTLSAGEPVIRMADSTFALTGMGAELVRFGPLSGTPPNHMGVGLIASGSTLNLNGPLLVLSGVTLWDASPQLQLAQTTIDQRGANSLIEVQGPPVTISGALLDATGSRISTASSLLRLEDTTLAMDRLAAVASLTDAPALIRLDQSEVHSTDFFAEISGTLSLMAPFARLSSSLLNTGADVVFVGPSGLLTNTTSEPLLQLENTSLNTFTLLFNAGGLVDLAGPLVHAVNSDLQFDFAAVESEFGGQIVSTSSAPFMVLDGGRLTSNGHLFFLAGSGLETNAIRSSPLRTGGSLLEARNGATIEVNAGNALRLDAALLDASRPILSLIGLPTQATTLSSGSSTMELLRSNVVSTGPVVALDRGLINVHNGPLISLSNGSTLMVGGDLLHLFNGSRINVFNGPLIRVTGTGSRFDVSGALVVFGGTGGNSIVVTNTITPTATPRGLPVSTTGGGSITLGPNPVKEPTLGRISVSPGGSLIQATGGGAVTITAP